MTDRPNISQISVLICTHNRGPLLSTTLGSLDQIRPVEGCAMEVVVIANACTDDTTERAQAWADASPWPARVIEEPKPGLSIARNRAMQEANGEVGAYLDDDVYVDPDWLKGLVAGYDQHGGDVVGGWVELWWKDVERPDWSSPQVEGLLNYVTFPERKELKGYDGLLGANFSCRRSVFEKIGGFDASLGRSGKNLQGGEEYEFAQRASAAGFKLLYTPEAKIQHYVAPNRLTREYLTKVAFGNAAARIRIKPRLSAAMLVRSLAGHLWLTAKHGLGIPVARLTRNRRREMIHRILNATGRGGLAALRTRLFTRSN